MIILAKIEDAYPGREDGTYTILFGDKKVGALISSIHSTSIRMGNILETIIIQKAKLIDTYMVDAFMNKALPNGIYLIPKAVMKVDNRLMFDEQPDFILVNIEKNVCKVLEVKLGDQFDTKKAAGEVESLKNYSEKLNRATAYRVSLAVVMWYAKNKKSVVDGFKRKITESQALTGYEFCEMAGLNYEDINNIIAEDQKENLKFLRNKIIELIPQTHSMQTKL